MGMEQPLRAPLEISFDYTRSLGPTLSQFMTALRGRRVLGTRGADGRVHAPPFEYDPVTHQPPGTDDFVTVGPEGTVTTWTWTDRPLDGQPLGHPFAWALVRLDGADTAMLHAVDAGAAAAMRTGMRVRPRWASPTTGSIRDIVCFEPAEGEVTPADGEVTRAQGAVVTEGAAVTRGATVAAGAAVTGEAAEPAAGAAVTGEAAGSEAGAEAVTMITTQVRLCYEHTASPTETSYLLTLAEGRLAGQRCPSCHKVYLPPRGACPTCGVPTDEDVPLPDTGIVTTFCVVNVPFAGQRIQPPYVAASVLIDGADIAFQHLVLGCAPDAVRMGMRVKAAWKPRAEWGTTLENITHFEPTGEPDAPYESYAHHL